MKIIISIVILVQSFLGYLGSKTEAEISFFEKRMHNLQVINSGTKGIFIQEGESTSGTLEVYASEPYLILSLLEKNFSLLSSTVLVKKEIDNFSKIKSYYWIRETDSKKIVLCPTWAVSNNYKFKEKLYTNSVEFGGTVIKRCRSQI